ncbi:PREDICTED: zinc finger protein 77-like [Trachymyrmex cornetzi]|uniref:zinc finger protein 77-like n=1 Tax=Trachymyrmex cornetzi TaxID=471704 RepID=UPI00084F83A8|nr:PREDICTED: zinc finger protein 77-like [Trachymyrmex cornetzi]
MGAILSRNRESRDHSRNLHFMNVIPCRNVCCKCNISFETKMSLDQHMQEIHDNDAEISYMCDYCNSISRTWFTFQQHIYVYHKDVVFCTYCYKAYSDYSSLFLHWKTHEPFECEICNDTFGNPQSLRRHRVALHRNTLQRTFFRRSRT